jgi:hypothetical protein
MKYIQKYENYVEEIATGFGKLLANISKGASHLSSKIGKTGNDEDLANNILSYLDKMSKDYNNTNDFDKTKISKIGDMENYVFFGNIFPKDQQQEYRVDVIKALNREFEKDPYRIIISKIVKKGVEFRGLDRYKPASGKQPQVLSTANPNKDEEMVQLDCSQQIAKKIYDRTKNIFDLSNKNTKGDARGGKNTTYRQPGKFKKWTW